MKVYKGIVVKLTIVIILAIGIVGCTAITKDSEDNNGQISTAPVDKENDTTPLESENPTETSTNENHEISKYKSGDMVDIAKAKLTNSVVTVEDSFMDSDGHIYDIFNQSDDEVNTIVIHLNKEFSVLKYSAYNKALVTMGSGSDGTSVISESTKDGKTIGDPLLSTVVPEDEIYPTNIEVDVTGLDYVVIVDLQENLRVYNFSAIAK